MFDSVFQKFDDGADSSRSKARLDVLRADLKRLGDFSMRGENRIYVVP